MPRSAPRIAGAVALSVVLVATLAACAPELSRTLPETAPEIAPGAASETAPDTALGITPGPASVPASASSPPDAASAAAAPPGAPPGTCWGRHATPAVIETVTDQIRLAPSPGGGPSAPVTYRTETRQIIVRERRETVFRTTCPAEMTRPFVETLQRALAVRGHYRGAVHGRFDDRTGLAVRHYQRGMGLDSPVLSLAAARRLGLAVVEVPGRPS